MVSLNVSIFTLVAISVDRYRAVINPLEAYNNSKLRTKGTIGFIWLFSVFLAIPTFMGLKVQYIKEPSTGLMTKPFCNMIGMDIEIWKVYNFGLVSLQYIFPLAVITYAYSTMGYRLCRETGLAIDARCNSDRIIKNKKKVFGTCSLAITHCITRAFKRRPGSSSQGDFPASQYRANNRKFVHRYDKRRVQVLLHSRN